MTAAAIQMTSNVIDGKNIMEGVGQAALMGAIGGALGGAVGLAVGNLASSLGSKVVSEVGKKAIEFGLNLVADVVVDVGLEILLTGEFSWASLGVALVSSLMMSGVGEMGFVKNIQSRSMDFGAGMVGGPPTPRVDVDVPGGKRPDIEIDEMGRPVIDEDAARMHAVSEDDGVLVLDDGTVVQCMGKCTIELPDNLPDAPPDHHWHRQPDGSYQLQRNPSTAEDVVPLKHDPSHPATDANGFAPKHDPPEGYEWRRNPDGSLTTEPPLNYDPKTGKFTDPETGDVIGPVTSGETEATRVGKEVHKRLADERRTSGEWSEVNTPMKTNGGEEILVPRKYDTQTGEPVPGCGTQKAQPDAVNYDTGIILDDKPIGRDVLRGDDWHEMMRYIKAYEMKTGELPNKIVIQRYDPATGLPVETEIYTPGQFLP